MIIEKYYENPSVLHIGTMPPRAYYIPCENTAVALSCDPRLTSQRLTFLNGNWKFFYYPSVLDIKEPFYKADSDRSNFTDILVPSVWQTQGYDRHQYTNNRYPFPYDPPYVPLDIPCAAYIRSFTINELPQNRRQYLNFEGVDACFYIWINGSFIGYSQVSHSTSEFDITNFLKIGQNELAVLVLKWCDGSYLEDQDKFRMSGIFRDVYLLSRPAEHIRDFTVTTPLADDHSKANVCVSFCKTPKLGAITYRLLDPTGKEIATGQTNDQKIKISVFSPQLWNAENPVLYTLLLETSDEIIPCQIGLREISVKNGVMLLNGQRIVFRGVNRHDSDPITGPVVSKEHIIRDMKLMKQHNINAIRTSHYPNAPYFAELCDQYGFYLIEEADLEANGPCTLYGSDNFFSALAMDPQFLESWVDRVRLMYERDKNHSCILMWSIGNESGFGTNAEAALAYIKQADPTRLTHYESDYVLAEGYTPDRSNLDTISRMYPPLEQIENYCTDGSGLQIMIHNPEKGDRWEDYNIHGKTQKPFVICEHSHAMGNSPGDLEAYYSLTMKYENLCGGFVWEWCDHAVYAGTTPDNRDIYRYGGDSGELIHDGNFCMDGLVYPNRKPHTGLAEYKNVIRPVRISLKSGVFSIRNMYDFSALSDTLDIHWEISCDGNICATGSLDSTVFGAVPPHHTQTFDFAIPDSLPHGHHMIRFLYLQKNDTPFVSAGSLLGFDQIELTPQDSVVPVLVPGEITLQENDRTIIVSGNSFRYVFDKPTGVFTQMVTNNNTLLERPMAFNIWRAPTDNDRGIRVEWEKAGFDRTTTRTYQVSARQIDCGVAITANMSICATALQRLMTLQAEWTIDSLGTISAVIHAERNPALPFLPRFGIRMFLPKEMGKVSYYGYGPSESYIDKHQACWLGRFTASAEQLHEDYIKPQENGSHWGCHELTIESDNCGLCVSASKLPFCFNVSPYTQEALTNTTHNYLLQQSDYTVFCLDYAQSGVGSNSCGPELKKEYRLDATQFDFSFILSPYAK